MADLGILYVIGASRHVSRQGGAQQCRSFPRRTGALWLEQQHRRRRNNVQVGGNEDRTQLDAPLPGGQQGPAPSPGNDHSGEGSPAIVRHS